MFNTPILFLVFNRPDTTKLVFDAISTVKPRQLFIAADGPREDKAGELELCEKVRQIATQVYWDCEVKTLFREKNLGCGKAPAEAISWFFENVEMGIILEDDCLPHPSFFYYCQELLQKYLLNDKIMNISGTNLLQENNVKYSYYFSKYNHTWGWATWRRAWKNYQFEISEKDLFAFIQEADDDRFSAPEKNYWENIFRDLNRESKSIWDYQWLFRVWKLNGISVTPKFNLVSNIGFGKGATHTHDAGNPFANTAVHPIKLPLIHPSKISINQKMDILFAKNFFGIGKVQKVTLWRRIYRRSRQMLKNGIQLPEKISDSYPKILGIPKDEIRRLRKSHLTNDSSIIFNTVIKITDPFWHLHSLNEIFFEEVYKFVAETNEPVIIDCGANIGLSVIYFKRLYPLAKLTAFEPDKSIYKMLYQNLTSLKITDVNTVNKAVWKEDGQLKFLGSGALGGKIYSGDEDQSQAQVQTIGSARLKSYLTGTVDFLKIDIEGAEFEVLKDCRDLLQNVKNLFVEYHSNPRESQLLNELLSILKEAGFRVYIKEAWNNLPHPFLNEQYKPYHDLQLNIFAYRSKS